MEDEAELKVKPDLKRGQHWRSKSLLLWVTCCWLCAFSYGDPNVSDADLHKADRAMLEFLADFDAIDEAEFDLLAAFAEQDAMLEESSTPPSKTEPDTHTDGRNE